MLRRRMLQLLTQMDNHMETMENRDAKESWSPPELFVERESVECTNGHRQTVHDISYILISPISSDTQEMYTIRCLKPRGPMYHEYTLDQVRQKIQSHTGDETTTVTSRIRRYLGPYYDWHLQTYTPNLLHCGDLEFIWYHPLKNIYCHITIKQHDVLPVFTSSYLSTLPHLMNEEEQ